MDLLAGYGSDADSSSDDEPVVPAPRSVTAPSAAPAVSEPAPARRVGGLLSGLPAPKAPASAQLPAGFFNDPAAATETTVPARAMPTLNGAPTLPVAARRGAQQTAAEESDEEAPAVGPARPPGDAALMGTSVSDIPAPSNTKLWSKLPAPQAAKRKVVIRSSLNAALLAAKGSDSDDDGKPAAKHVRTGTASKGSGLASFLPPPKNEVQLAAAGTSGRLNLGGGGGGGALGGRAAAADGIAEAAEHASEAHKRWPATAGTASQQYAYAAVSDQYTVGVGTQYAAEVPGAEQYSYAQEGQYEEHAAAQQYADAQQYQQQYEPSSIASSSLRAAGSSAAAAAAPAAAGAGDMSEDMLAAAMAEEAERMARRGGVGTGASIAASIQFKEVNASQLKHADAARREAQQGMRAALGSEYAQQLRAQATPFAGDKLARRKHQIGTLFHNAKAQELEMLETRAAGMQSKAQTKQKYGW